MEDQTSPKGNTLVSRVSGDLRAQIATGLFHPGDRLPSEAQLTKAHGVSRTVIREAIATLRSDGLVEARQGAGVFVLELPPPAVAPFADIDPKRISSIIEVLELRTAVEVEAAGLAALRHTPLHEERITACARVFRDGIAAGEASAPADYDLHLAIADASGNPRFREFLGLIDAAVIPRRALQNGSPDKVSSAYLNQIQEEHERIVTEILNGDEEGARAAMRLHLKGSQARYRTLLRDRPSI